MEDHKGNGTTFTLTGGVGSMSFTVAAIADAGTALHRISELLDPLLDRLRSEWLWLADAAAGSPDYPVATLEAMRDSWWQCLSLQGGISALSGKAVQAATHYEQAESRNANALARAQRLSCLQEGLSVWTWGGLAPLKIGPDLIKWLTAARRDGLRDAVQRLLTEGGAGVMGALGPGAAIMYLLSDARRQDAGATSVFPTFLLRKAMDHAGLARPGYLQLRQLSPAEWKPSLATFHPPGHAITSDGEPWTLEASIRGVLSGSNDAYGYPPGSIAVIQIVRADGSNAWVVHLPGTEDWSTIDSSNPFDMEGNMEALTAVRAQEFEQSEVLVRQMIKEALRASGALPGEDVLLTGHSGGGIHAAAAAADPAFLAEVNVKMIVIAGSPAKNSHVDPGISVLDLQNENDIVTAADFGSPAPSANWVTATSRRPPADGGAGPGGFLGQAHSLDNYLEDAAELDAMDDPAVESSRETLRTVLGAGIVGAAVGGRKWVYQGRDIDIKQGAGPRSSAGTKANEKDRYRLGIR